MAEIKIYIGTLDWTMGNHCYFDLIVKYYSVIKVDWGDGNKTEYYAFNEKVSIEHNYFKVVRKYMVCISSEDDTAIYGIPLIWKRQR